MGGGDAEPTSLISALITPFGLFESILMHLGFENAPQVYQRLVDNSLYNYLKIKTGSDGIIIGPIGISTGSPECRDIFTEG